MGTTNFLHVSASVGIVSRGGDSLSTSTFSALPVKRSSCAFVGRPVLRRLPAWLNTGAARHHLRQGYSKSVRGQRKKRCNRVVQGIVPRLSRTIAASVAPGGGARKFRVQSLKSKV